jgi:hypothetical protein
MTGKYTSKTKAISPPRPRSESNNERARSDVERNSVSEDEAGEEGGGGDEVRWGDESEDEKLAKKATKVAICMYIRVRCVCV